MKRWFAIPLIVLLLFLAGCKKATEGPKAADTETPVPVSTTVSPPTNTPAPVLQVISASQCELHTHQRKPAIPLPILAAVEPGWKPFCSIFRRGLQGYDAFSLGSIKLSNIQYRAVHPA